MKSRVKALNKENNQLDEQLNKVNGEIVTNMVVYIRSFYLSDYQQEVIRHDITQMVLEGQLRGDEIETIIGEDYKSFCDNILKELPKRKPLFSFLSGLSLICLLMVILTGIWFLTSLTEVLGAKKTWPMIPIYMGTLLSALFIVGVSIFIVYYICRNAFAKTTNKKIPIGALVLIILAYLFGILSRFLFKEVAIINIHVVIVGVVMMILFIMHKGLDYYIDAKETRV